MNPLVIALVISLLLLAVILVLFAVRRMSGGRQQAGGLPYVRWPSLFNPSERSFLGVLDLALGSEYRVFGKVRLEDLVKVREGLSQSARLAARNRVKSRHVDFVICNAADLKICGVVDLDDSNSGRSRRRERDSFVEDVLRTAQIPLVRIPARRSYTPEEVRECLSPILQTRSAPDSAPAADEPSTEPPADPDAVPACPQCGQPMVLRKARKGRDAGGTFWGCPAFPACKGLRAAD